MSALLQVTDAHVAYGKVEAVRSVSLEVGGNEIVTIIGANGAGKTTLLNAIMGVLPLKGFTAFAGEDMAQLDIEDRVAAGLSLVPEHRELFAERLRSGADLDAQRALTRARNHLRLAEGRPDAIAEPEPLQAGRGQHDGVVLAFVELAQPRVDVPAQRLDRQGRLEREQLRAPAHRRRPDPHPGLERPRTAERVARILALRIRADREPFDVRRGHVLSGVHGEVGLLRQQRLLDLLDPA